MAGRVSDKSNNEIISQMRDQFMQRERETEAKYRRDFQEVDKAHRTELAKVKTDADQKLKEMQEENNLKLNKKDLQFQKEFEALKAVYTKRAAEGKKV
jgi:hypothetical protein